MKTLGARIKQLRKLKHYTGLELAKMLNVAVPTISMWESDKRRPGADMLQQIASIFNVSIEYLLTGNEPTPKGYYEDPETAEYAEYLRTRPEAKMLFSASKDISKEEMEEVVNYIEYLKTKHK
jgi:bacteriophage CI repressor helix-turn-helix domain